MINLRWTSRLAALCSGYLLGCVVPPFNAAGKLCTGPNDCPAPFVCAPASDGQSRCIGTAPESDGGGGGGGAGPGTTWQPERGLSWQIQERGTINTAVDASVFAIGIFESTPQTIATLHQLNRRVICRFAGGVAEASRSDSNALPAAVVGNAVTGESGMRWLNVRSAEVRAMVTARIELAATRDCDGVSLTWVDGWQANTGFSLTDVDLSNFLKAMAIEAHARHLSLGLDNAVELTDAVADDLDFAINEGCVLHRECNALQKFGALNKPVFHFELRAPPLSGVPPLDVTTTCMATASLGFSTIIKSTTVDETRLTCP